MENEVSEDNVIKPIKEGIIHSVVGDIHVPSSKLPFDMNFEFTPNAPSQISSNGGYGVSTTEKGIQAPKPGFFKTAAAEAYEFNATAEAIHYGYTKHEQPDPLTDIPSPDWKPTSQPEIFYDIQPQYLNYLSEARGPKDLQYRRDRVLAEQQHDETLQNGSMFSRIIGGIGGVLTDPVSYIPIAGEVKYAKFAPTILKAAQKAFPGIVTASVIQSASHQLDRINGNLQDFVIEAAIGSVFGTAIYGGYKGLSLGLDKMELWNLRDISKATIKGVDFKFTTGENGELTGIKAFDITGNMSAAEVSYAQELADSSFNKSGFFKIPYVGDAVLGLKSYPGIGSPLLAMLNSPYMTVRGFIDRVADHGILTKGIAEGEVKPKSFEFFMKKEYSGLRSVAAQLNALHLERLGFDTKIRPIGDLTQIGLGLANKLLKFIGQDLDKTGYVSKEEFYDEIQRVLITEQTSDHASVNEAAALVRQKMDDTYKAYLRAYNLPEDILPPKTAAGYLMRVYDTPYMNINKDKWVNVISNYLEESDRVILDRLQPIKELEFNLEHAKLDHENLIKQEKVSNSEIKASSDNLEKLRRDLKIANDVLQNDLRNNPEFKLHLDDMHALSADEAKELEKILKPYNDLKKQIDAQQRIITELKTKKSKSKQSSMKGKTAETAKKHAIDQKAFESNIAEQEAKLDELKNKLSDEEFNLYEQARKGDINPRLYYPSTYKLKDPNNRLKFRETYASKLERENHAKAYYDTIMHMNPEDTIADVMGKIMGNGKENHLMKRTLLVPDELLYNNNFMTKDLMAKLSNYVSYLARRTHLKNVFKDVTHDGGIEPLLEKLNLEYKAIRAPWEEKKAEINEKLKTDPDNKELKKQNKELDKKLQTESKKFKAAKTQMSKSYEKMMGIRQRSRGEHITRSMITSITAMTNLHFVPATQIADLGSIGLQHGVWPFVRDAVYPVIESLGGILKTKDSEALRKTAPSVHLALQDVLSGYADKDWSMEAQPYLNLGRWVGGIEKMAHFSANTDLTTYIDNGLQRLAGATVQAEYIRILEAYTQGTMTKKEGEYLRKYGIDPKVWAERMVKAFKDSGGYKTKLGGYQSKFWEWQDLEAANEFSDAVFRGIQNTIINRGMFDSPFWADNMLGMLYHTFTGWGYASVNRYLIPRLQRPDAEKMLGVMLAFGFGSLVSPLRRAIRGEDPYPENMTDAQKAWEAFNDSNATSAIANVISWANLLADDKLIGDLKNDKYRDRMKIGAAGPFFGTANRLADIFSALSSGKMNEKDAKQMARMLPITGSIWGYYMSKMLIENLGLPPTRRAAKAENG